MRYLRIFLPLTALLFVGACGLTAPLEEHALPSITGILVIKDPKTCPLAEGCGPKYSLLDKTLSQRVALAGKKIDSLFTNLDHGLIFTVTGDQHALPSSLVSTSGYENIQSVLDVMDVHQRTQHSYLSFLTQNSASYTKDRLGCALKWNKSYLWDETDNVVTLTVVMTNTEASPPTPYLSLTYDGNSGKLLSEEAYPSPLPHCKDA
ncbi:MAG: hypothetical protein GKR96_03260 [Gammaproteobacteria bacterium]|nr:hypothetical protein [Gammaproteobacteria bacterium]